MNLVKLVRTVHFLSSPFVTRAFYCTTMSCCPPNAEKYLAPDYSFTGSTQKLADGTEFYHTGNPASKKTVILVPDIFGWNGGRTRNVADFLAGEGYYTIVPKLLSPGVDGGTDGDGFRDFKTFEHLVTNLRDNFPYDGHLFPIMQSVTNHLKATGVEKIGLLGFCWGGWVTIKVLNGPLASNFSCQAIAHPSIHLEGAFGGNPQTLFDHCHVPTLLMPANGDPTEYYEDGAWFSSVKHRHPTSKSVKFLEVQHGFLPRGDIKVTENKQAVDRALAEVKEFFAQHM